MHEQERRARAQILRPGLAGQRISVGRCDPPPDLAAFVDYFWWVDWDTPEPHLQSVIPRPVIHLSLERSAGEPRLLVTGVQRRRFDRVLEGSGNTVAAAFWPGGFRPFLGSPVGALRDRAVPAGQILAADDRATAAHLEGHDLRGERGAEVLADWLRELRPEPDPHVDDLAALVTQVEQDRTITRAAQVASLAGVGLRTLQRQFQEYIGVGPKWVVQLYRLIDVAAAAHGDEPVDWAMLATELGYTDQSHLIRAFSALVGDAPASYVSREG